MTTRVGSSTLGQALPPWKPVGFHSRSARLNTWTYSSRRAGSTVCTRISYTTWLTPSSLLGDRRLAIDAVDFHGLLFTAQHDVADQLDHQPRIVRQLLLDVL